MKATIHTFERRERSPKTDRPWFWVYIYAPQIIRENIGGDTQAALATSVYVALCLMAARQRSQTFEASISVIATHAGLHYRKTHELLWLLEKIGLIAIQENKVPGKKANMPHTFTLLSLKSDKSKKVAPNGRKALCPGSAPGRAGSIKDTTVGSSIIEDKENAPADAAPALPDGSGATAGAKEEQGANSSMLEKQIGGAW